MSQRRSEARTFAEAAPSRRPGIVREFVGFVRYYKKWWLLPALMLILLLGLLVTFGATGAAPFIYTLF